MQICPCPRYLAAFVLLPLQITVSASTIITSKNLQATNSASQSNGTCEFRTINYITDSLPQQCLKSAWSAANATVMKFRNGEGEGEAGANSDVKTTAAALNSTDNISAAEGAESPDPVLDIGLDKSAFLSFEEWKKQTLDRVGQKEADVGNKKVADGKKRESDDFQNRLDSLGEEGEIDLDFSSFRSKSKEELQTREEQSLAKQAKDPVAGKKKDRYMSKDAGKTCKERFSYASFDAGATVLKTHPGAKNAKSVLIENKDSYMLSECASENKFIIIELSEDIWIDTLVLANYEFFSSMIRTFRVSVSDRFPVKMEKWKDIGTYEARNSREIQVFLIQNPQIWARYIRIEFLSHYGNEYYCPLSLVRVHGTRMLESWKETEAAGEDEDEGPGPVDGFVEEAVAEAVKHEEMAMAAASETAQSVRNTGDAARAAWMKTEKNGTEARLTPWMQTGYDLFDLVVCLPQDEPSLPVTAEVIKTIVAYSSVGITSTSSSISSTTSSIFSSASFQSPPLETISNSSSSSCQSPSPTSVSTNTSVSVSKPSHPSFSPTISVPLVLSKNSTTPTFSLRNKTTSTISSSSALPTIQESFFKAISRRLTLLESNSTLSLTYISEATSHLQHAFASLSRDLARTQLTKTTTFLDTLNSTVLSELRGFRQQYDEIWQSTIISLESQREESRREILAVSERLNILAQEVVWQRRMGIVQSGLLLICLALVIFSRVEASSLEMGFLRPRSRGGNRYLSDTASRTYRQYSNFESQSEPGSPNQWSEVNRMPYRTEHNLSQGPKHHQSQHMHRLSEDCHSSRDTSHSPLNRPCSSSDLNRLDQNQRVRASIQERASERTPPSPNSPNSDPLVPERRSRMSSPSSTLTPSRADVAPEHKYRQANAHNSPMPSPCTRLVSSPPPEDGTWTPTKAKRRTSFRRPNALATRNATCPPAFIPLPLPISVDSFHMLASAVTDSDGAGLDSLNASEFMPDGGEMPTARIRRTDGQDITRTKKPLPALPLPVD